MLYFWVSVVYTAVNAVVALIALARSPRNILTRFYAFCVGALVSLGLSAYLSRHPDLPIPADLLRIANAFLYAVFPFFFLHFMLVFVRRYEILRSKKIILANYFAGIFSYTMVLLNYIPVPFTTGAAITPAGYVYYLTWMSILFSIGVALLYSLVGGFGERGMKSNLMFVALVVLMLILPTPFTLSMFSIVSEDSSVWYFFSSTAALSLVVFIVFRHRITMNTPYQAMKSALAAMNDILIKTDMNFHIEMVQGAVLSQLGFLEFDLKGRLLTDLLPDHTALLRYRDSMLREGGRECAFEVEVQCKDGSRVPMDFSFTPVFVNEEICGLVGVGRNVGTRRRAEQLKDSLYHIAQAADTSADPAELFSLVHQIIGTVMPARNFAIALFNDQTGLLDFPYFVDEVDTPLDPLPQARALTNHVLRTGRSLLCTPDIWQELLRLEEVGSMSIPPAVWLGVPLAVRGKTIGVMAVQDYARSDAYSTGDLQMLEYVSSQVAQSIERKRAEQRLRESEEKYRQFFEEDLTGDAIVTVHGEILECNPQFLQIFGFGTADEARRTPVSTLYPAPRAHDSLIDRVRRLEKLANHEQEMRRLDGSPLFIVENVTGVFDADGALTHLKMYMVDMTERCRLEQQLRQAQKMENLGSMAGGIAHDFNNILTIMSVHLSMIRPVDRRSPRLASPLEAIGKAVDRGAGLVGQLLTFARKADVVHESVNVNQVIIELTGMLRATFPRTLTISINPGAGIPTLTADANQLNQAILNLCVNGRDAMPHGGTLTITTSVCTGESLRERFPEAPEETYVVINVADTGTGMDEATRGRLFEPFFTTKEKGKGTGLGLAVVYGVVRGHNGFIDVESEQGVGTTFSLYLPTPPATIEPKRADAVEVDEGWRGSGTILLVEDEDMVRDTMATLLEDRGFEVITAADGYEAVAAFRSAHHRVSLVLTDIGLPGQNGWEAFLMMRAINPGVRGIFATGYVEPEMKAKMIRGGATCFIMKPYIPAQLYGKIREMLSTEKGPRELPRKM